MFTQRISLTQQDANIVRSTKLHELGSIAETADGRVFRYAQAGAVNLAAGKMNVAPAKVANHTNIAVALAAGVNTRDLSVTVGATAVTTGQYNGGYAVVNDGAGVGQAFLIDQTPAIASGGTGKLGLRHAIKTALDTSSKVALVANPFSGAIVAPGSGVGFFANGVSNVAVSATYYYWSQVAGVASVLSDGVITKGSGAILSDAVAGAVEIEAATSVGGRLGTAIEDTVTAKYYPVFLSVPVY